MFDDPKKELRELEGQLLAAETKDEETGEFRGIPEDPNDPPIRNFANGYGRAVPSQPEVPAEEPELPAQAPRKDPRGLVILACAECVAIAAVAVYWFFRFL